MGNPFWRTSISRVQPNHVTVRGYDLAELIGNVSFGEVVYLLMKGELPEKGEGKLIEAILVSACDHSLAAPSADAVRFVASSGVPLQTAVAAGILAIGEWHAGAIEECARLLQQAFQPGDRREIRQIAFGMVRNARAEGRRMPGFGHPYHTSDPRVKRLLDLGEQLKLTGNYTELARHLETELLANYGKKIPMNVDGAIAAIISDLGIDWRLGKGFFIIARSAGLVAHAHEQMTQEKPFKAVELDQIDYKGPDERPLRK